MENSIKKRRNIFKDGREDAELKFDLHKLGLLIYLDLHEVLPTVH